MKDGVMVLVGMNLNLTTPHPFKILSARLTSMLDLIDTSPLPAVAAERWPLTQNSFCINQ